MTSAIIPCWILFELSAPNAPSSLALCFHPLPPSSGWLFPLGYGADPLTILPLPLGALFPEDFGVAWLCRVHAHSHHVPVLVLSWLLLWIFNSLQQILGDFSTSHGRGERRHGIVIGQGCIGLGAELGIPNPSLLEHTDPTDTAPCVRGHGAATLLGVTKCQCFWGLFPAWQGKANPVAVRGWEDVGTLCHPVKQTPATTPAWLLWGPRHGNRGDRD